MSALSSGLTYYCTTSVSTWLVKPPTSHPPRWHTTGSPSCPVAIRGSASCPIREILVESLTPPLPLGPICGTVQCSPCTSWLPLALLSTLCWAALSKASSDFSFPSSLFSLFSFSLSSDLSVEIPNLPTPLYLSRMTAI